MYLHKFKSCRKSKLIKMVVLIVTGSMNKPPINCDVRGLERMSSMMNLVQYDRFKRKLCMEAEPFANQSVFINKTAAEVLSILTDFGCIIVSQSQDSAGDFITWTLMKKEPFLKFPRYKEIIIRRDQVKHVDRENNNHDSDKLLSKIVKLQVRS